MSKPPHRALGRLAIVAMLVGPTFLGACTSDDSSNSDGGPTTTAPEERVATDAEVADGLAKMQASVAELVAAGPDTALAAKADDELEPVWQEIEGTIKRNEPDVYVDIEDSMSLLSSGVEGDEEKGALGAKDITTAIAEYLAKHPG